MSVAMQDVMKQSGVAFGTSGARGLVSAMTDRVCYVYARSFIKYCEASYKCEKNIAIAGDLRPSTGRILQALVKAGQDAGWKVTYCGRIPSPAIALYGLDKSLPTIMVTGSHIPADRNGIKFNHPNGEITKADEQGIVSQSVDFDEALFDAAGMLKNAPELPAVETEAEENYCKRYPEFFGEKALQGLTIGVYQHSAVGRDIVVRVLESLGACVKPFGRSDVFVPVDTEAIRPEDEELAREFTHKDYVDAVFSTDGDSDRLKEFPTEISKAKLAEIREQKLGEKLFGKFAAKPSKFNKGAPFHGKMVSLNEVDGYRMEFDSGDIVHLRPSGNAPEFRCYVETEGKERSAELLADCLKVMEGWRK